MLYVFKSIDIKAPRFEHAILYPREVRSHRFDFKRRRKTRLSRILFVFGVEMDDTITPHWVTDRPLARTSASTWKWRKGPETVLYQSVRLISNEPRGILSSSSSTTSVSYVRVIP